MDISNLTPAFFPFLELGKAIFEGITEYQKNKSKDNLTIKILKLLHEPPESFGSILMLGFLQSCDNNLKNVNKVQKNLVQFLKLFNGVVEEQKHLLVKPVVNGWDAKRRAILDAAQAICNCDVSALQECMDVLSYKKILRPVKVYNDIREIPRMWLNQKKTFYSKDIKVMGEENLFYFVRYLKKGILGKWREFEECCTEKDIMEDIKDEDGNLGLKKELEKQGLSEKDLRNFGIT